MNRVYGIFIICISVVVFAEQPCVQREYGEDTIVCVCNATYCDTADPVTPDDLSGDAIRHYVSNQAGMRLASMTMQFSKDSLESDASTVLKVQRDVTYQKILGYGGAMTDAASINIASLSKDAQDILLRQYFSEDGSKYAFIRIPVGGTDFSTHYYEYENDTVDATLENFNLTVEDYEYKIPTVKRAQEIAGGTIKIYGSAWSAPDWMKTIFDDGRHSRLLPEYYQLWADYYIKFLDIYKTEGIEFWGLTTQNEPFHGRDMDTAFNSMGWTVDQQREWLVGNFGPTLEENGYGDVNIIILDDQRVYVKEWSENIYGNETANGYSAGMGVHWYEDSQAPASVLTEAHEDYPDKFLLYTESCLLDVTPNLHLGNWTEGQSYISSIIEVSNNWVSGWVDWNLALDLGGGPNWANNFANAPIIVNATADEFYKQPMYYAIAHISKFVPVDSVRIGLEIENDNGLETVAFLTPDDIVVVVIHNKKSEDVTVVLSDEDKGQVDVTVSANSFNTLLYI